MPRRGEVDSTMVASCLEGYSLACNVAFTPFVVNRLFPGALATAKNFAAPPISADLRWVGWSRALRGYPDSSGLGRRG